MSAITPGNHIPIARLLSPELVLIGSSYRDKDRLLEFLVQRLCAVKSISCPADILQKLLERERGINTTLDTGLSLPHARVDGLIDIAAILCLLPEAIIDPRQKEVAIRAMFLFFSPDSPGMNARHLQFLRGVSLLFQAEFLDKLLKAPTSTDVLDLIRSKER